MAGLFWPPLIWAVCLGAACCWPDFMGVGTCAYAKSYASPCLPPCRRRGVRRPVTTVRSAALGCAWWMLLSMLMPLRLCSLLSLSHVLLSFISSTFGLPNSVGSIQCNSALQFKLMGPMPRNVGARRVDAATRHAGSCNFLLTPVHHPLAIVS